MEKTTANVFVYGTLKKGKRAHKFLNGCDFLCDYDVQGTMYGHGLVPYPMIKLGGAYQVYGEVYKVSDETLKILDQYEGHPHLYKRQLIEHDCLTFWVYEYQGDVSGMDVITSGVY